MKKTLIINIGNSIIHIEEDAYEILTAYLNEIKQHFAKSADDFEIVTDIENRIAEMFQEILQAAQRQVVEISDVEAIISQMGKVQDFETEESETSNGQSQPQVEFTGDKKLYRDTEDGVLAGVCAGLGHYFNVEARWMRLVTFLSVFLGGSGILAYLILWIAMPRAVTRAQRMEMKGEAANLFNYKRSFEEELAAFKKNMDQFGPYVKKSSNFISEIINVLIKVIGRVLRLFTKAIAVLLIVFGFMGLVTLVISLSVLLGIADANPFDYFFPLSVVTEGIRDEVAIAAFVTFFVPILVLILFAIRVAFGKKSLTKTASFALLIIWLIGIGSTGYYVTKILSEFQEHAEIIKTNDLKTYPNYTVDIDNTMGFSAQDSAELHINDGGFEGKVIVNDDDHPFRAPRKIHLDIEKSEDGKTTVTQNFQSQGKTFQQALTNAQNITYQFVQKDSVLTLSPRLQLKKKAVWRNQEVRVSLKVPVGTRLLLNENIYWNIRVSHYACQDESDNPSAYREWIMTEDGLKCKFDLTTSKISETEHQKAMQDLEQQIQKQKVIAEKLQRNRSEEVDQLTRRLEELKRKKQQLEQINP